MENAVVGGVVAVIISVLVIFIASKQKGRNDNPDED